MFHQVGEVNGMSIFNSMKQAKTFESIWDYENLLRLIKKAEEDGRIIEIPVSAKREVPQMEHWYQDKDTGSVYSLLPPEFPAKGYWGPVPLGDFQLSERVQ
jgi:hypothetical protein